MKFEKKRPKKGSTPAPKRGKPAKLAAPQSAPVAGAPPGGAQTPSSSASRTRTPVPKLNRVAPPAQPAQKKAPAAANPSPAPARTRREPNREVAALATPSNPVSARSASPGSRPARKRVIVPPILLEGDADPAPSVSGPGERFALPPQAIASPGTMPPPQPRLSGELPESYGTGRLFLTARDPHWLYAAWDLTTEQRQACNRQSKSGHMTLRAYVNEVTGAAAVEHDVHPESKSWFIPVPSAGTCYVAELGYYGQDSAWRQVAVSRATFTPPENLAHEETVEFVTIPPSVSLKQVFEAVKEAVRESPVLAQAVQQVVDARPSSPSSKRHEPGQPAGVAPSQIEPPPAALTVVPEIRAATGPQFHAPAPDNGASPQQAESPQTTPLRGESPRARLEADFAAPPVQSAREPVPQRPSERENVAKTAPKRPSPLTAVQARALVKVVWLDEARRVWMGSLEITELIRRHLRLEVTSPAESPPGGFETMQAEALAGAPGAAVSSLQINEELPSRPPASFWLNVNAELVLYGATEPTARVKIGPRQIRLRADGTFSYRFALPDGEYPLTITAEAADSDQRRGVALQFSRQTRLQGEVGKHPQDSRLHPPLENNIQ